MNQVNNVVAIVVTYQPEFNSLQQLLDKLNTQVKSIVIVDNGSGSDLEKLINSRCKPNEHLICLGANFGVAAGHNAGIDWAFRNTSNSHVILFDQDSLPANDMVFNLMCAMQTLTAQGYKVAAVGPLYNDVRIKNHAVFFKVSGWRVKRIFCRNSDIYIETDMIITSGSLIALSAMKEIGGPLDSLFIDMIDLEWCLRARFYKYGLYGVCRAILQHSLGDSPVSLLGYKLVHHSPLRHYYIFRNCVWLISKRYVPMGWKLYFVRTIFIRFFIYCFLVTPRMEYLKMMAKGAVHGMLGKLGKLREDHSRKIKL